MFRFAQRSTIKRHKLAHVVVLVIAVLLGKNAELFQTLAVRASDQIAWPDWLQLPKNTRGALIQFDESNSSLVAAERLPENLQTAVSKRQIHYLMGRQCAAFLLGENESLLQCRPTGEALWPVGVVGSITHTQGVAAAVVGSSDEWLGVGIDAERVVTSQRVEKLRAKVFREKEWSNVRAQSSWPDNVLFTAVFSAKECIYKAYFGSVQKYFGFHQAEITAFNETGLIEATVDHSVIANTRAPEQVRIRVGVEDDLVLTVAAIAASKNTLQE